MLAEKVQHANHVFSMPTGPTVRKTKGIKKIAPVIIMPEMANAVICPDTGKSLKHQELITILRYKIKLM
jgi:DNA topoisomerase IB